MTMIVMRGAEQEIFLFFWLGLLFKQYPEKKKKKKNFILVSMHLAVQNIRQLIGDTNLKKYIITIIMIIIIIIIGHTNLQIHKNAYQNIKNL